MRIHTQVDLDRIKEASLAKIAPRLETIEPDEDGNYPANIKRQVVVCAGSGCISCGCKAVAVALRLELVNQDLTESVEIIESGCIGLCTVGPILVVYPEGVFYQKVPTRDIAELVRSHFLEGRPLTKLMAQDQQKNPVPRLKDIPFFAKQTKIVLEKCGLIEATSIDEYIAQDGYQAAIKALTKMQPAQICQEIVDSGLRGRGGAGFPTGIKWGLCLKQEVEQKYIICNADEGAPGAFMDRSVLEGDPFSIMEGMLIGGFAIGADQGFIYVRAEYPLAIERLEQAIAKAHKYGMLGHNILGSGFDFDIEIRIGAGAFVCGEETALMNSIEGLRGEPRTRPPFPAESGLWGKPTNINNVETLANIAWIINHGAAAYAAYGSEKSKGTKVLALAGDVCNTGLVEAPMGITLREIVFDIGGGIPGKNKTFKAAQLGGPSGGCVPAEHLDTPIDYESLKPLGAMMGSGGLIVMNNDNCMVDMARFFMDFVQEESCGKCSPCRVGTKRMLEALTRITDGKGQESDLEMLEEIGPKIIDASLCGLGKTSANPVISTIRYFRHEYEAHIRDKKCEAGVCKPLFHFEIDANNCTGCTVCAKKCQTNCISGERKQEHLISQKECVKCGECYACCKYNAVLKVPGAWAAAV